MPSIHPTACISSRARVADDVQIGAFCVVEDEVEIGSGCRLENHVVVKSGTTMGPGNWVCEHAVLGGLAQHKSPSGPAGRVRIGARNMIREQVTIHRALAESAETVLGDDNLLMVSAHIAHDCRVGNQVILANNVMLAGHVEVGDRAFMSGASAVHQFCRVGTLAMVGGQAHITKDVPPYVTIDGLSSMIVGLNVVGLRRAGFTASDLQMLKAAYRVAFRMGLRWEETLDRLRLEYPEGPASAFHQFLACSKRGCVTERSVPKRATLKLYSTAESAADTAAVDSTASPAEAVRQASARRAA